MPRIFYRYLVVHPSGEMRVTVRTPQLRMSEVAFKVRLSVPDSPYGKVMSTPIQVALPEQPTPEVAIDPIMLAPLKRSKR